MTWIDLRDWRSLVVRRPLVTAFTLSLIIHVFLFGFWRVGKQLGWWQHQATWLLQIVKKKKPSAMLTRLSPPQQAPPRQREIPLTFVEVDPAAAIKEAPKDAKYYAVQNTKAANPDVNIEREAPKIEGTQEKTVRLENVPKPLPFPLQPAIAPDKGTDEQQEQAKAKQTPGDLARIKDDAVARIGNGESVAEKRPRTIAEAKAQKNVLVGEKTRQDAGVRTRGHLSLTAIQTPFASYDAALIAAVQQRWYDLLESYQFTQQSGKVVLEFRLHSDGRISDMTVNDNEVGDILMILCQRAIQDPSPYAKWPDDMRRMIQSNFREVRFTFFYN
jgi:hypothetical protein